jgi:hypothetical protein
MNDSRILIIRAVYCAVLAIEKHIAGRLRAIKAHLTELEERMIARATCEAIQDRGMDRPAISASRSWGI